jgi:hypothetical protein
MENLKYPIGRFEYGKKFSLKDTRQHIKVLDKLPTKLKKVANSLSETQLETPYRPDGWTARQVVHHIADSHINMYIRIRFALTEENPTIKGYDENDWANLPDAKLPIKASILIIEGVHKRMVALFKSLDKKQLKRTYYHSGYQKNFDVQEVIALYAWHSEHHLKHIEIVAEK